MINKNKIKIVLAIFCFVIIGVVALVSMYNKPQVKIAELKTDLTCTATRLLKDYELDEVKANTLYLEKILEVKGVVLEAFIKKGKGVVVLQNKSSMSSVICHLSSEETLKVKSLNKGNSVTIKGICTGYLMDVILVKSIITKKIK